MRIVIEIKLFTFQAMSVILFNTKLSAATGKQFGLVTDVFGKTDEFEKELKSNVQRLLSVPLQVLLFCKNTLHAKRA
jgi:enoyl-CoA hydratase/carnithine racemase